jgi:bifunctional enzyme CysN/CysC
MQGRTPLALVLAGHVDHGKSSLLGRLLNELDLLPVGKAEELAALSARRGVPLEWSFVLDSFQAERDQAITLDTTRVRVRTPKREFMVIDAPGHKELLKNMIGGASAASAALLVLDAQAGAEEQTLRHAYLLAARRARTGRGDQQDGPGRLRRSGIQARERGVAAALGNWALRRGPSCRPPRATARTSRARRPCRGTTADPARGARGPLRRRPPETRSPCGCRCRMSIVTTRAA